MCNEKIQGSGRQRRLKNHKFNCNKLCNESSSAHCHIWTLEDSLTDEGLSRFLFWHELQAADSHEELNSGFVLLNQAHRLTVQLSSPAETTFSWGAGAAPPCSGYFHWQWAKGKLRETGSLCISDQSFSDTGHRGHCKSVNCTLQGPQESVSMRQLNYIFLLNRVCT